MAQSVTLDLVTPEQKELPKLPKNYPFILSYQRTAWNTRIGRTAAEDKIVPSLIPFAMQPGTNGVGESIRFLTGDIVDVLATKIKKCGGTMLPPNSGPACAWNPTGAGYITVTECRDNDGIVGKHYCPVWDDTLPGSEVTRSDYAKFDAFVAHWQAEKLIPKHPPIDVILMKISELRERLARTSERGSGKPMTDRESIMRRDYAAWQALAHLTEATTEAAPVTIDEAARKRAPKASKSVDLDTAAAGDAGFMRE